MFSSISPMVMFIKLHHRPLVNGKGNVQQMEMFGTLGLSPPFPLRTKPPLPLLNMNPFSFLLNNLANLCIIYMTFRENMINK